VTRSGNAPGRTRLLLVTLAVGLVLTALASLAAFAVDARRQRDRDAEARSDAVQALREIDASLTGKVQALVGLFDTTPGVTEQQFEDFTRPITGPGRSTYALSWLERVAPAQRAAYERRTGDTIRQTSPDGALVADTSSGDAFVVRYATGTATAKNAKGLNAYANPQRRAAIERAATSGEISATPVVRLVGMLEPGFVLYAAVPPASRSALRGVVAGSFGVADVRAALRRAVRSDTSLLVTQGGRPVLAVGDVHGSSPRDGFIFAGQTWAVQARAAPPDGFSLGPATLVVGLLLTCLAMLAVWGRSSSILLAAGRRDRERAERRFVDAIASAPIGMALVTRAGGVLQVNDAFCRLLERDRDWISRHSLRDMIVPDDLPKARETFDVVAAEEAANVKADVRLQTGSGERWVASHLSALAGEPLVLVQVIDITERREFEGRLVHQAEHDSLTDLLNRRGFRRVLADLLAEREVRAAGGGSGERRSTGAVMVVDLDHFKAVNDLHGHHAGDQVLQAAARVLRRSVREQDTVARLGGDEFGVLLPDVDAGRAQAAAARLLDELDREAQLTLLGGGHGVSASVGVAMLDDGVQALDDALVAADLAMYDAKDAGRRRFAFFDPQTEIPSATRTRLEWVERIRASLAEDRLRLVAQPIRDLRTGRVVHHELLLRMTDRDGSEVLPGAFLPIAEQFAIIGEIDRWVAREAIAELAAAEDRDLVFHVNVSGASIGDAELLAAIRSELERTGVDACRLVFEITETAAVTNLEQASAFANQLRACGCRLALDDFGAGFGSFVYLQQLPFDMIKIDGQFVRECATNPSDRVILESLIHAARGLDKQTVAEFVEDQATEDLLRTLGVDLVQGYHVGRPGAIAAIDVGR
jgi:diguanylate cyclase (GGDEF)-like protein/PAS domain S-box-containing protein